MTPERLASLVEEEQLRLGMGLRMARTARDVPRRLGADASGEELAADKLTARRVVHRLTVCLAQWGGDELDYRKRHADGASIDWAEWWEEWEATLRKRMAFWANTFHRLDRISEGNVLLHRWELELDILTEVFK